MDIHLWQADTCWDNMSFVSVLTLQICTRTRTKGRVKNNVDRPGTGDADNVNSTHLTLQLLKKKFDWFILQNSFTECFSTSMQNILFINKDSTVIESMD